MIEAVHIRMGRAALHWSARKLGSAAGVSPVTIARFETGSDVLTETLRKLERALEKAGVIFISRDAQGGPGVRLKR